MGNARNSANDLFPPSAGMASRTRIISVAKHEQAIIRIDEHAWKVTLEFQNSVMTVFEQNGMLFTRMECFQPDGRTDTASLTLTEDSEDNIETQPMTPPARRRSSLEILKNVTIRRRMSMRELNDLTDLQMELFGSMEAGETQLDLSP